VTEPVPLREYLEAAVAALDSRIDVRLNAADRALKQADQKLDVRLNHANDLASKTQEWMKEVREEMVMRVEHRMISERLQRLEKDVLSHLAQSAGKKAGLEPLVAIALIFVAAAIGAIVTKLTT
jgi:hypothetical protein